MNPVDATSRAVPVWPWGRPSPDMGRGSHDHQEGRRRSVTERLIEELRKLKGRPDTERLIEELRKLKDRPDTQGLAEELRKLKGRPDMQGLAEELRKL